MTYLYICIHCGMAMDTEYMEAEKESESLSLCTIRCLDCCKVVYRERNDGLNYNGLNVMYHEEGTLFTWTEEER